MKEILLLIDGVSNQLAGVGELSLGKFDNSYL